MGLLTKAGLDDLLGAGCPACSGKTLVFRSYVVGCFPMMGGEPVGKVAWTHDGEEFVDGVYRVACADCGHSVFSADLCPRCHAEGGLAKALGTPNAYPVPAGCPRCDGEEIRYYAMVPARKTHGSGGRPEKARTDTEPLDDGFHGLRASCKTCGDFAVLSGRCPLCEAPGPLRAVPR